MLWKNNSQSNKSAVRNRDFCWDKKKEFSEKAMGHLLKLGMDSEMV